LFDRPDVAYRRRFEKERKMKEENVFPPGWDEERVRRVLNHYETLSEGERS